MRSTSKADIPKVGGCVGAGSNSAGLVHKFGIESGPLVPAPLPSPLQLVAASLRASAGVGDGETPEQRNCKPELAPACWQPLELAAGR